MPGTIQVSKPDGRAPGFKRNRATVFNCWQICGFGRLMHSDGLGANLSLDTGVDFIRFQPLLLLHTVYAPRLTLFIEYFSKY